MSLLICTPRVQQQAGVIRTTARLSLRAVRCGEVEAVGPDHLAWSGGNAGDATATLTAAREEIARWERAN